MDSTAVARSHWSSRWAFVLVTAVGVVLTALGMVAFRRRDVPSL